MTPFVLIAGLGQLVLAGGSLALPGMLGWREQTAKLRPLTRQVFWTYAAYIWCTNVFFGSLSLLGHHVLLDGSPLARIFCGYVACYWGARVGIQFFWLDRSDAPKGWFYTLSEIALVTLFLYLTALYGWIALAGQ